MITYDKNQKIFSSNLINDNKVVSGFGTKALGDGKNRIENIFKFLNTSSINHDNIVIPEQIHSTNIQLFDLETNEKLVKLEDTDGVITKKKGAVLTVVTADCCPIIYYDDKNGVIGISHNGWRGSIKRLVQKMVDGLVGSGAKNESIKVAIGPSIGECCYNVDDERYYVFKEEFDGVADKIFHLRNGKWHLNLALLNYLLLLEKGIRKENIDFFPFCTKCDRKRFFSFRRDRKQEFGEMFSFVMKINPY